MATEMLLRNVAPTLYVSALQSAWRAGAQIYDPSIWLYREPEIDEKMMRDADIAHVIGYRTHLIAGPTWNVRPDDDKDEKAVLGSEVATELIRHIRNFTQSRRMLSMAFLSGARYAEIRCEERVLTIGDGKKRRWYVPVQLKDMDKRRFRLVRDDWGQHAQRNVKEGDPKTTHAEIHWEYWSIDREEWIVLGDEEERRLVKNVYMDDESSLGHGRGLRDALGWWWYAKEHTFQESLEAVERFAQGILTAKIDGLRDANTLLPNAELVRKWTDVLEDMRSRHILVYDADDEVEVVRMSGEGWQLLASIREELRNTIFSLVLAANLPTGGGDGETGSYGKAAIQENSTETLVQFDREILEESLRDDLVGYLWWKNWRNIVELGLADTPLPRFDLLQEQREDPEAVTNRATALLGAGVDLVATDLYEKTGFKKPEPGEEVIEGGGGQPPGGFDPMGGGPGGGAGFPGGDFPSEEYESQMSRRDAQEDEGRAMRPVPDEEVWFDPRSRTYFFERDGELIPFEKWDESKVNRHEEGAPQGKGGQFAPKDYDAAEKGSQPADAIQPTGKTKSGTPVSTTGLTQVGGQGGSNPGGMYENAEGERWYIKKGRSESHAKTEVLAARLYELAGVRVPEVGLTDYEGSIGVSSKIENVGRVNASELRSAPGALAGFAVDAWLANWDVIGLEYDNMLVTEDGEAIRLDTGGALKWRAQGEPKGDLFGPVAAEVDSMRKMGTAKTVFGGLTDEQIARQIRDDIEPIDNRAILRLADEYGERGVGELLVQRRTWLIEWAQRHLGEQFAYSVRIPDNPDGQPRCDAGQPTGGEWAPQDCGGPKGGSAAAKADWKAANTWTADPDTPHKGSWSPKAAGTAGAGAAAITDKKKAGKAAAQIDKMSPGTVKNFVTGKIGAYSVNPTPENKQAIADAMRFAEVSTPEDQTALHIAAALLGITPFEHYASDTAVQTTHSVVRDDLMKQGGIGNATFHALDAWAQDPTSAKGYHLVDHLDKIGAHDAAETIAGMHSLYYKKPEPPKEAPTQTYQGWKVGDKFNVDNDQELTIESFHENEHGETMLMYHDSKHGESYEAGAGSFDAYVKNNGTLIEGPSTGDKPATDAKMPDGWMNKDLWAAVVQAGEAQPATKEGVLNAMEEAGLPPDSIEQYVPKVMGDPELLAQFGGAKPAEEKQSPLDLSVVQSGQKFKSKNNASMTYVVDGLDNDGNVITKSTGPNPGQYTIQADKWAEYIKPGGIFTPLEESEPSALDMGSQGNDAYTTSKAFTPEQSLNSTITAASGSGTTDYVKAELHKAAEAKENAKLDKWDVQDVYEGMGSHVSAKDSGLIANAFNDYIESGEHQQASGPATPKGFKAGDVFGAKEGSAHVGENSKWAYRIDKIEDGFVHYTNVGSGDTFKKDAETFDDIFSGEGSDYSWEPWTQDQFKQHLDKHGIVASGKHNKPDFSPVKDVIYNSVGHWGKTNTLYDSMISGDVGQWAEELDSSDVSEFIEFAGLAGEFTEAEMEAIAEAWNDAISKHNEGVGAAADAQEMNPFASYPNQSVWPGKGPIQKGDTFLNTQGYEFEVTEINEKGIKISSSNPLTAGHVKGTIPWHDITPSINEGSWQPVNVAGTKGAQSQQAAAQTTPGGTAVGDKWAYGSDTYKIDKIDSEGNVHYTHNGEPAKVTMDQWDAFVDDTGAKRMESVAGAKGPQDFVKPSYENLHRDVFAGSTEASARSAAYVLSGNIPEIKVDTIPGAEKAAMELAKAARGESYDRNVVKKFRQGIYSNLRAKMGGGADNYMSPQGWAFVMSHRVQEGIDDTYSYGTDTTREWAQEWPIDQNFIANYKGSGQFLGGLRHYTSEYREFNRWLRGEEAYHEDYMDHQAEVLDAGFRAYPRRAETSMIYRGVSGGVGGSMDKLHKEVQRIIDQGGSETITMDGIQSCSSSEQFGRSWGGGPGAKNTVFHIETDHGVPAKLFSQHATEDEIILNHGDEYEIVDFLRPDDPGANGMHVIKLRHVTKGYKKGKFVAKKQPAYFQKPSIEESNNDREVPMGNREKFVQPVSAIRFKR